MTDCHHPVLIDNPQQPLVNIYLCARCDAEIRLMEFEVRRPEKETKSLPVAVDHDGNPVYPLEPPASPSCPPCQLELGGKRCGACGYAEGT